MELTIEEYINKYTFYIEKLSYSYAKTLSQLGIEYEDLYQVSALALISNYNKYDSSKSSLTTFTYNSIKFSILEYIKRNITITNINTHLYNICRKFNKQNLNFYMENGRYMSYIEQAKWLSSLDLKYYNTNYEKLANLLTYLNAYHFKDSDYYNDKVENDDEYFDYDEVYKNISDNYNLEEEVISKVDMEIFLNSLTYLTDKEKKSFIGLLGLEDGICNSVKEQANQEGVSHQCISERYQKALIKIRKKII